MKRFLILYALVSLLFLAPSYAAEPGSAITQLEDLFPGHEFPMPDTSIDPQEWIPQQLYTYPSHTEDCSMQNGVEICIAPNWPDCDTNGDVEPCIDHVQQPFCYDGGLPIWANFDEGGHWYQGCHSPWDSSPTIAGALTAKADESKLLMRAEEKGLSVLLGGRKIHFNLKGGAEKSRRGSFSEFLANDPCQGLMACYNPANAALINEILSAYSAKPEARPAGGK